MTAPLYDTIGRGYAARRRADPRLAAAIDAALGDAERVVNVGAGAGSYEPRHRDVVAIEPSDIMIAQRPAEAAPCVRGHAEDLPLETGAVDAAMAVLTMHHWSDVDAGLREMARVARRRIVILTWVPDAAPFWLTDDYFPEIAALDRTIFPTASELVTRCGQVMGPVRLEVVPIPHDCIDGMLGAYWQRPASYLHTEVRAAISSFARIDSRSGLIRLRADLENGRWLERYGALLARDACDLGYRLVTCEVGGGTGS